MLLELALENIVENKLVEAYCLLEKAVELKNDFSSAHAYLGWLLAYQFEDFEASEYHLKLAQKITPDDNGILHELAITFIEQNKFKEAKDIIIRLLNEDNLDKSLLYYELGLIYEKQDNFKSAVNSFDKAIEFSNEYTDLKLIERSVYRCNLKACQ